MNLEWFGEELKQLRLERKISLIDISTETRINPKFLEAIERGQFHILPQTYIRAFLREYATILGLDPSEMMQRYDLARKEIPSPKMSEPLSSSVSSHNQTEEKNIGNKIFTRSPLQRNIIFGVMIIAAIVLVTVLANLNKGPDVNKTLSEVPFDRVVRETEAISIQSPPTLVDSSPAIIVPKIDSLRLEITTLDSVWISLLIDGKKVEQHLFGPNKKRLWIAKEQFVITMGNAGGATFRLNGKDIGPLGRRGAVVRNTVITEANLKN